MGAFMSCFALNIFECGACMACSCFTTFLNWTMSQAARFGHLLIIVITFSIAIVLGKAYPASLTQYSQYSSLNLTEGCNASYINECIYRQLIYRASLALLVLFTILAPLSAFSDGINKGFWLVKLTIAVGLFVAFWWGSNSSFSMYAEAIRVFSFLWLLIQGILLLDFGHDAHDLIMRKAEEEEEKQGTGTGGDSRFWLGFYLFSSLVCLTAVGVGLAYLFIDYTGCQLGMFFTVLTLIMGVLTTIISLLNVVNKGLLTPCLLFAYSVFMCWYALLSYPNETCNPYANYNNQAKDIAVIVVAIVSMAIILYCVTNGTKILNIFNLEDASEYDNSRARQDLNDILTTGSAPAAAPKSAMITRAGDEEDSQQAVSTSQSATNVIAAGGEESGTVHERVFFHVLMILVSSYGGMILTSWGSSTGSPESETASSAVIGNESMWFKIVSQWLFLIFYCRVLQVAYQDHASQSE